MDVYKEPEREPNPCSNCYVEKIKKIVGLWVKGETSKAIWAFLMKDGSGYIYTDNVVGGSMNIKLKFNICRHYEL